MITIWFLLFTLNGADGHIVLTAYATKLECVRVAKARPQLVCVGEHRIKDHPVSRDYMKYRT